tara:strand:- start:18 stop:1520 length:1503 start_codon:yes stop_codon:yes gene_type:complete
LGAIASLAFAPVSFWPAVIAAQIGLLYLLHSARFTTALLGLWAFWALHFGTAMYWMYLGLGKILGLGAYTSVSLTIISGLIYSAFLLLPWLLFCACSPGSRTRLACFPLAWLLCEWFRYWILGGLTWLHTGYVLQPSWLSGWIPVFGVLGGSLAASLSAVLLYVAIRRKKRLFPLALVLLIWGGGGLLSTIDWTQPLNSSIPVTIVQPEAKIWLQQPFTAQERDQLWNQEVAELSREHWRPGLLLWPERGLRADIDQMPDLITNINLQAETTKTALVTGGNYFETTSGDEFDAYNSIYGLGAAEGVYLKEKLAPLGERNLLRGWLGLFGENSKKLSTRPATAESKMIYFEYDGNDFSIASSICYEIAWGSYLNAYAGSANILANLSNDRWFHFSPQLEQTLEIAQIRALEQQKPLLRSSFGGYSAHINYRGEVVARVSDTSAQTLVTSVEPRTGQTPYAKTGDLPVILLAMFIWLLSLASSKFMRPDTSKHPAANAEVTE